MALAAVAALFPAVALAQVNNVGSCGWGSKLFDGQNGIVPQGAAGLTNALFFNQTFGVSFGTSGCTQDGAVRSTWKTSMFIDGNKERLARDMSVGSGEALDSLAHLLGVEAADRAALTASRDNMKRIFLSDNAAGQIGSGCGALAADARARAPHGRALKSTHCTCCAESRGSRRGVFLLVLAAPLSPLRALADGYAQPTERARCSARRSAPEAQARALRAQPRLAGHA
jgi:hypothetical protein